MVSVLISNHEITRNHTKKSKKEMKTLVTGATGFVGRAVVEKLATEGLEGAGGVELYTCGARERSELPNYFSVDISSRESVKDLFAQIDKLDAVIHSAGLAHQFQAPKDAGAFDRINVEGTRNVAEMAAAAGCRKFVLISSISVYGDGKPNPCGEDAECKPVGAYAVSKYAAEKAAGEICEKHGIELVILRLATVYGNGDVGNVLRLIKLIDSGRFFWTGKGDNCKSLIHNSDAARACALVLKKELKGVPFDNVYNVTDTPHSMREIVETIAAGLGRKIPSFSLPPGLIMGALKTVGVFPVIGRRARGLVQTLKKWQSDDVLSGEKARSELGFYPETDLSEGIKNEIRWHRNIK